MLRSPAMMYIVAPLLLCAGLLAGTSRAQGQAPAPPPQQAQPAEEEEAAGEDTSAAAENVERELQQHVQLADQLYAKGEYEQALKELREASELDAQPIFLYKAARCYQRLGRNKEALELYKRFLRDEPSTPLKVEVEGAIKDLMHKEEENQKPIWKKGWFWGIVAGAAVVVGVGIGVGVYFGTRSPTVMHF